MDKTTKRTYKMTQSDKTEIKEMLSSAIELHTATVNGKFDLIKQELAIIKEQTTKTNGRVTHLEKDNHDLHMADSRHYIDCPNVPAIKDLQNSELSRKTIWKFFLVALGIAVSLSTIFSFLLNQWQNGQQ